MSTPTHDSLRAGNSPDDAAGGVTPRAPRVDVETESAHYYRVDLANGDRQWWRVIAGDWGALPISDGDHIDGEELSNALDALEESSARLRRCEALARRAAYSLKHIDDVSKREPLGDILRDLAALSRLAPEVPR